LGNQWVKKDALSGPREERLAKRAERSADLAGAKKRGGGTLEHLLNYRSATKNLCLSTKCPGKGL